MHLTELGGRGENRIAQASKQLQMGFEPGLPRLRVRHSTSELQRSRVYYNGIWGGEMWGTCTYYF